MKVVKRKAAGMFSFDFTSTSSTQKILYFTEQAHRSIQIFLDFMSRPKDYLNCNNCGHKLATSPKKLVEDPVQWLDILINSVKPIFH